MMVWKMIFPFQGCILRLDVNLPGCSGWKTTLYYFIYFTSLGDMSVLGGVVNIFLSWRFFVGQFNFSKKAKRQTFQIPSGKLTWQWKTTIFNRRYIFKWLISHCYGSLPEGISVFWKLVNMLDSQPVIQKWSPPVVNHIILGIDLYFDTAWP